MFADDTTTLSQSDKDLKTLLRNFHKDIENLSNCFFLTKLILTGLKHFL